jgi:hypothetical protein
VLGSPVPNRPELNPNSRIVQGAWKPAPLPFPASRDAAVLGRLVRGERGKSRTRCAVPRPHELPGRRRKRKILAATDGGDQDPTHLSSRSDSDVACRSEAAFEGMGERTLRSGPGGDHETLYQLGFGGLVNCWASESR